MQKLLSSLVVLAFAMLATSSLQASEWTLDPVHSSVKFAIGHMVIAEVEGKFNEYSVTAHAHKDDFSDAKINVSIKAASIDTDNKDRDDHLRGDDFFSADKFANITFKGKQMKKVGKNKYKLIGDLTIRDVTKTVELDVKYNGTVKDPWGNTKAGFKATGSINRFDYGLSFDKKLETGGLLVGDEVEIRINLELAKKA